MAYSILQGFQHSFSGVTACIYLDKEVNKKMEAQAAAWQTQINNNPQLRIRNRDTPNKEP